MGPAWLEPRYLGLLKAKQIADAFARHEDVVRLRERERERRRMTCCLAHGGPQVEDDTGFAPGCVL